MFNLVNHSDTIACVLFELLVNLELIIVGFQTHVQGSTSFSFVQFSRSCSLFASRVTAYLLYLMKFLLSRTFSRFFEVFSWAEAPRKSLKGCCYAVFSGFPYRSRAGQLDYNTTGNPLCQQLFSVFLTNFGLVFWLFGIAYFLVFHPQIRAVRSARGAFCYYIRYRVFCTKVLLAVWPPRAYTGRQK